MITRAEALTLFKGYNESFSRRVDAQIRAAASSGVTPILISYENVTNATAIAVANELTAAGWTVSNNSTDRVITIS